ncbi:MAG: YlxM family DNA-binding protein [Huintestinicola sp.]
MNGEKNLDVALLLDYYSSMLTDKQKDVIDLYYNEDLSLAEIAEQVNITRQGVRDSIKRGEQTLFELENALKLRERSEELLKLADSLEISAEKSAERALLMETAARIREIIEV